MRRSIKPLPLAEFVRLLRENQFRRQSRNLRNFLQIFVQLREKIIMAEGLPIILEISFANAVTVDSSVSSIR